MRDTREKAIKAVAVHTANTVHGPSGWDMQSDEGKRAAIEFARQKIEIYEAAMIDPELKLCPRAATSKMIEAWHDQPDPMAGAGWASMWDAVEP